MVEASFGPILTEKSLNELENTVWLSDNIAINSFEDTLLTFGFSSTNNTMYCFPCLSDVMFCIIKFFMIIFPLKL